MPGARKLTVVAVALLLVAGACGGGDKKDDAAKQGDELGATPTDESTTSSSTPDAEGGGTATTKPGSAPAAGASSGGSGSGATVTTKPGSIAAAPSSSSRFAAAGDYILKRTGKRTVTGLGDSTLDGEGSLRVDAPANGEQHSNTQYGDGGTEQTVRPRAGGIDLVFLKVSTQGASWEFRPSPPVLFAPDPIAVGNTWSWKITSTDGALTIEASFKAVGNETITIGGEPVSTVVVEGTSKLSGAVNGTLKQKLWGSDRYRLIVRSDDVTDTSSPFVSHAESSSVLTSTKPR